MSRTTISIRELRKGPLKLATDQKHTITVSRFDGQILEMEDLNFHHDSAVLLPDPSCDEDQPADSQDRITGLGVLRACYAYAADNADERVVIAGHADASGNSAEYNFTLSQLRAEGVRCALTGDRAGWVKVADKKHKVEDYQQILLWASYTFGWNCDPGDVDDVAGERTEAAVRGFQKRYNLEFADQIAVDGVVGKQTWGAFFDLYMRELAELMDTDLDGLDAARSNITFVDQAHQTVGCGASHPIDLVSDVAAPAAPATGDAPLAGGYRSAKNRRVEILFFEPGHEPEFPCHPDTSSCVPGKCEIYRGAFRLTHLPCDRALNPRLRSRHALDLLEAAAQRIEENEFLAWSSTVFGSDVPLDSYRAWRADVVAGNLKPPYIRLVDPGVLGDEVGDYNDDTEEIRVAKDLPLRAESNPADAAELFLVLLHEFGHHVDNLLRRRYSDPPVDGDAPGEEGALFALGISGLDIAADDHVVFAAHIHDGESHDLLLSYPEFQQAVKDYVADPQKQADAKKNNVEGFSAGRGRPDSNFFAHRSIEDGLGAADSQFFTQTVRDRIYFGNWERDYSQFCGSSTLRALQIATGPLVSNSLPRRALTEFLDRKAREEFPNIQPTSVTTTNLGVYRPEEHVDNPQYMPNDQSVDPDFRGTVSSLELAIDPATGLKNYIAHDGQPYDTSTAYVAKSLARAAAAGLTSEGLRLLGQSLHTLEDLYAHSNFVELALIRLGHPLVFPWVSLNTRLTVRGDLRYPMVTGVFGFFDAMVSLLSSIGEGLAPPIQCQGKVFSKAAVEAITLLLNALANSSPDGQVIPLIEPIQVNQDQVGKDLGAFSKALCDAGETGKTWIKRKLGAVLRAAVGQIALFEANYLIDLNTKARTDPTHSMLSKDHPDHPLHPIAAACASSAVATVGLAMRDAWLGARPVAAAIAVATSFFVHPNDIPLVSGDARADLVQLIDGFAKANPGIVANLDAIGSLRTFRKQTDDERKELSSRADEMVDHDDEGTRRALALLPDLDPHLEEQA